MTHFPFGRGPRLPFKKYRAHRRRDRTLKAWAIRKMNLHADPGWGDIVFWFCVLCVLDFLMSLATAAEWIDTRILQPNETLVEKSQIRINAEKDLLYAPYCLRCSCTNRMNALEAFFWRCRNCGAEHDERISLEVN